jgi:hypothetical protein
VANFVGEDGAAAHCEYFASAAVLLLRSLGIPARYVTGFLAHEAEGGRTTVRQRDAHAWAEAWLDGAGWVTVEATPPGGRPDGMPEAVSATQRLADWWTDTWRAFRAALGRASWPELALGAGAVLVLLLAGYVLVGLLRRFRASAKAGFAYTVPAVELAALGARFGKWLHRQGQPCPPQCAWEEHLEQASAAGTAGAAGPRLAPDTLAAAREFVCAYNRARFGGGADGESLRNLEEKLARLIHAGS